MADKCVDAILGSERFKDIEGKDRELLREFIEEVVRDIREKGGDLRKVRERSSENLAWLKRRKASILLADKKLDKMDDINNPNAIHEAALVGRTQTGDSNKNSIAINREVLTMKHQNKIDNLFDDTELELIDDINMSERVADAIYKLNNNLNVAEGPIRNIAKKVRDFNKYIVQELNSAGIELADRADYIFRQTHDIAKIAGTPFRKWSDALYDKLDIEKTFGLETDKEVHLKELKKIYNKIVSAEYGTQGSGSLGRARALHFKDGINFAQYHREFGEGSFLDVMQRTARNAGKAEAIYRVHPEGRKAFERLEERQLNRILKSDNPELIEKFKKGAKARENMRKQMFGYGDHPSMNWWGEAMKVSRTIQAATKLPLAFTSTFTDFSVATANFMAKTGNDLLSTQFKLVKNYFTKLDPESRKRLGSMLLMNQEFDTIHRYTETEGLKGKFDKYINYAMKMTMLDKITKANRNTMAISFAEELAHKTHLDFDNLHPNLKSEFKSFGISDKMWNDVIRNHTTDFLKTKIIDISSIENRDVQIRFANMIWSNSKFGAIAPGDATKAIMRFGFDPNSNIGQTIAAITQFKTFSLEAVRAIKEIVQSNPRADNRTFLSAMNNMDNKKLLSSMMFHTVTTAMVGIWVRDLMEGREPRALTQESVFEAVQRSVLPLQMQFMNDVLYGTYNNRFRSLVIDALGPTASLFNEAGSLASSSSLFVGQELGLADTNVDPRSQAFRFFRRNTPFAASILNAPILKPILDTMLFDEWNEQWNPGYKRRKLTREKEKGSLLKQVGIQ